MSEIKKNIEIKMFSGKDFPEILNEETGKFIKLPENFILEGWSESSAYTPSINPEYVFTKKTFRDVSNFLKRPHNHALWLYGPTGSGKTSVVTEIAGRLNWPVFSITCNSHLESDDLIGRPMVVAAPGQTAPSVKFIYGPLARAMKLGGILILNEVDLCDPAQLSGLNDVLEGRPLIIPQNGGEVIKPHRMFRVVVTANSKGSGDETGQYSGVLVQNIAALDRYSMIEINYLPEKVEQELIAKVVPQIPREISDQMVRVANLIRNSFTKGEICSPMSTRTLCFWGQLLQDYQGAPNALKSSVELCFSNRLSVAEKLAVHTICQQVFGGNDWLD